MKNKKVAKKDKQPRSCQTCDSCLYVGEGDSFCDVLEVLVMEDHFPSNNYNSCKGKKWKPQ